ncbi:MAG: DUF2530 domain-containing protein [Geodermatophilaceae bacterium]|nr:DUF2530 domain-containing protein [Geodermatophilaceae bacterium]
MSRALRPAPPPREINAGRVAVAGTILSLVGFLVLLFCIPALRRADAMVWLWSFLAAFLIGLWGLGIALWQGKTRGPARRQVD